MRILPVVLGIVMAGTAAAQDKKTEVSEEGKAVVTRAVEAVISGGGIKVKGSVDHEANDNNQMFQMMGLGKSKGYTGKFTVTASGGTVIVSAEDKDGSFEVIKRGDKVIKRQVWEKEPKEIDEFAAEVSGLVDFERIKANLGKAKFGKPTEKEVDGKKVTIVKGTLPIKIVGADEDEEIDPQDMMNWQKYMKMSTVDLNAEFRIAEDGKLAAVTFGLAKHSKLMDMVKILMGQQQGNDEEDEEDKEDGKKAHATVKYKFEVEACGSDVKADVPRELNRYFEK